MKLKQPELRKARIEIIPMIDTIFFLLVFFMIAWLSMVKMNGLTLPMPRENGSSRQAPPAITLSETPTGAFFLDKHVVSSNAWEDTLRRQILAHPNGVVVVNVAPALRTQALVSTLDSVKRVINSTYSHTQILVATPHVKETGNAGH